MKRVAYSVETKYKAVEMKTAGFSTKEIMEELNIRNRTQVKSWWLWYQNEESMFVLYLYPQSLIICLSLHFSTNQCYNLDNEND